MRKPEVYHLILDVVRDIASGRPVASGTEFSQIGIGPWQRQRFFGLLRDAFNRHGLDITGSGVTREGFTYYETLREVQAAIWTNLERLPPPRSRSVEGGRGGQVFHTNGL
jgi:hypothetical protein